MPRMVVALALAHGTDGRRDDTYGCVAFVFMVHTYSTARGVRTMINGIRTSGAVPVPVRALPSQPSLAAVCSVNLAQRKTGQGFGLAAA